MNRLLYPDNWHSIAREIKESNGWRCQECDRQCRRPGEMAIGWEYELQIAHYDNEYESDAIFVVAWCAKCHFRHDAPFVWVSRKRADRLRQRQAGQLELIR